MTRRTHIENKIFVRDKSLVKDIIEKYHGNWPIVYGVPRSGSTLLRNILNTIFDGNIAVQQHDFFKTDNKVFCAYRDFRDSTVSQWRIQRGGFSNEKNKQVVDFNVVEHNAGRIKSQVHENLNKFKSYYDTSQIYFACYESYFDNFDTVLDDIERFLDINIKSELRDFIKTTWHRDNVKRIYSDAIPKFWGMDRRTEIHGQHIYKGLPETWKELLTTPAQADITNFFTNELKEWGYEL